MAIPADTLRPDSALLSAMRADPHYDYARELVPSGKSLWSRLMEGVGDYFSRLFDGFGGGDTKTLVITMAVLVLVAIVVVFLYKNPQLFSRNRQLAGDAVTDEDNIYGVDFDAEVSAARRRGNWPRVVRLVYLRTLRVLADAKVIDWRPSKTPTQYTYEVKSDAFRTMTRLFLRVRYGGFPADAAMAEEMESLSATVTPLANGASADRKGGER